MVEMLMGLNFKFHYIPAEENKILDCFSRLTREIREAEHFEVSDSVLADHSLINKIKKGFSKGKCTGGRPLGGALGQGGNDRPRLYQYDTPC